MFKRLLQQLGRELRRAAIPYMIIGGQAVLLYGEPRPRDIEDVKIILVKNAGLDLAYIRSWLDEFDRSLGITSAHARGKEVKGHEKNIKALW